MDNPKKSVQTVSSKAHAKRSPIKSQKSVRVSNERKLQVEHASVNTQEVINKSLVSQIKLMPEIATPRDPALGSKVLFIEPFYGGSHKQLLDTILRDIPVHNLITLSPKKWHWRARCSGLTLSVLIPQVTTEQYLFCSSVLNLAELIGLRSDLQRLKKIVYFHENQLVYPVQTIKKERDVQYALNEITTCLVADVVIFNSNYNMKTFLTNIRNIVKMIPDYRPKNLEQLITSKCKVLYFPVRFPRHLSETTRSPTLLHIAWPHRWEFDKNPELFINTLIRLKENQCKFSFSLLGENFTDVPEIFRLAKERLREEMVHYGFVDVKENYYGLLTSCHVVVSTSKHEFFGVSMLEATYCGCFPLVPKALVYPEIYSERCLYDGEEKLFERLREYCRYPGLALNERREMRIDFKKYSADVLVPKYLELFK